jgi:hypothetical protein
MVRIEHPRTYNATREELSKIDDARARVRRGEVATDADVEAVFAKHRRSGRNRA